MPVKIARSAARPSFGLPELLVAIHTSRQSCSKAGKARIFALIWESSGESRVNGLCDIVHRQFAFAVKLSPIKTNSGGASV
jgi:hypothetical protein